MMEDTKSKDGEYRNRYFPRMDIEVLLSYWPLSADKTSAQVVRTSTLGLGGLMFESDSSFAMDSLYHLDIVFGEEKMSLTAKVVYSIPGSDATFRIGVEFTDLSDEQREQLTNFFIQEYEKLPPENF